MNKKIIIISIIIALICIALGIYIAIDITEKNSNISESANMNNENNSFNSNEKNEDIQNKGKSAVIYFSATNNTKKVAEYIKEETNSDIIEIIPKEKYTENDLNYNTECRANREQKDSNSRPEISNNIDISSYEVIYLGYPIWWGDVPKIILTLIETTDFNGKTVIPFCTSGGSTITQSVNTLKSYKNINWNNGRTFNSSTSKSDVELWINELKTNNVIKTNDNLQNMENENIQENKNMKNRKIKLMINNKELTATLVNNSSVDALISKLSEAPITIDMHDYSNFEKVGNLGFNIPRNDENIDTDYGDLILYQGNSFVIYYAPNSWNFTRLGKIDNISQSELKEILGSGNVTVTISLY